MADTGLKNKVVLITGANHGIGAAAAFAFAKERANVFLTYRRLSPEEYGGVSQEEADKAAEPGRAYYYKTTAQSAETIVKAIRDSGGECHDWEADLADPEAVPKLFARVERTYGGVDVLVNNAAHDRCDTFVPPSELKMNPLFVGEYPIRTLTADSHDEHFAVNTRAVALLMKEYSERYIARKATWGRIVNISTDGAFAHPSNVSYGASKWAMESYSRAAAVELGPYGITVNVVSPGAVQTGWMTPRLEKAIAASYPLRRIGKPEDIAHAIVFFASEQAGWITGQVLYVGGGNRM